MENCGIDLHMKSSEVHLLGEDGRMSETSRIPTTEASFRRWFGGRAPMRICIEASGQSAWAARILTSLGHEVVVANSQRVRLIAESTLEERQGGRRDAGPAGAHGPGAAVPDPPQERGDPAAARHAAGAPHPGEQPYRLPQHRTRPASLVRLSPAWPTSPSAWPGRWPAARCRRSCARWWRRWSPQRWSWTSASRPSTKRSETPARRSRWLSAFWRCPASAPWLHCPTCCASKTRAGSLPAGTSRASWACGHG